MYPNPTRHNPRPSQYLAFPRSYVCTRHEEPDMPTTRSVFGKALFEEEEGYIIRVQPDVRRTYV